MLPGSRRALGGRSPPGVCVCLLSYFPRNGCLIWVPLVLAPLLHQPPPGRRRHALGKPPPSPSRHAGSRASSSRLPPPPPRIRNQGRNQQTRLASPTRVATNQHHTTYRTPRPTTTCTLLRRRSRRPCQDGQSLTRRLRHGAGKHAQARHHPSKSECQVGRYRGPSRGKGHYIHCL